MATYVELVVEEAGMKMTLTVSTDEAEGAGMPFPRFVSSRMAQLRAMMTEAVKLCEEGGTFPRKTHTVSTHDVVGSVNAPTMGITTEVHNVTELVATHNGKEKQIKVKTSAYNLHGIPVYLDTLHDDTGVVKNMELGTLVPPRPMVAEVQFKAGKPYKVLVLRWSLAQ